MLYESNIEIINMMFLLVLNEISFNILKYNDLHIKREQHQHYGGFKQCLFSLAGSCWWCTGTRPFQPGSGRFGPGSDRWGSARWSGWWRLAGRSGCWCECLPLDSSGWDFQQSSQTAGGSPAAAVNLRDDEPVAAAWLLWSVWWHAFARAVRHSSGFLKRWWFGFEYWRRAHPAWNSARFCTWPEGWVRSVRPCSTEESSAVMMLILWSWLRLMSSTSPVTTSWISCSGWVGSWYGWSRRMLCISSAPDVASTGAGPVVSASPCWRSLLWVLVWALRLSIRANDKLQMEHRNGFFPVWDATWRLLALGSEKVLSQMLQLYGFSPLDGERSFYSMVSRVKKFK